MIVCVYTCLLLPHTINFLCSYILSRYTHAISRIHALMLQVLTLYVEQRQVYTQQTRVKRHKRNLEERTEGSRVNALVVFGIWDLKLCHLRHGPSPPRIRHLYAIYLHVCAHVCVCGWVHLYMYIWIYKCKISKVMGLVHSKILNICLHALLCLSIHRFIFTYTRTPKQYCEGDERHAQKEIHFWPETQTLGREVHLPRSFMPLKAWPYAAMISLA